MASVTLSASATSNAALPNSPPSTTACAITLTLTASTVSAPASRASCDPARGDREAGVVVPHHHGGRGREPPPAEDFLDRDVAARKAGRGLLEHRRRRGAAFRERQREPVEQQVGRTRPPGRPPGRLSFARDLVQARGARKLPGEQRRAPRVEVGLARELRIERLERLGSSKEQGRSGAAAAFRVRGLGAQQVQAGALELVQRTDLGRRHHPASRIESARPQTVVGGGERAVSPSRRVACQRDGALQERGGGGEAAARLRASCRELQLSGDVLVGSGRRQRAMPRTAIGVGLRIARLRQGAVHTLPVARRRRPVDGRAHQWMTEPDPRSDLQKLRILGWSQCARLDPQPLGRAPEKRRVPHRIRRRQQHQLLRRPRQFTDAPQVVVLDMTR